MGQSQGSPATKQFSNNALKKFQEHYSFHSEKNDERWGVIQVWKEKGTTSEVMLLTKNFHDDHSFKEFLSVLKPRQAFEHPNLVQFLGWSNEDADGICGQNRKFHLYVEFLSQNLEKEISRRTAGKEYFEEAELWYTGRAAVNFGAALQQNGISHGDFRPVQILLTEGHTPEGQVEGQIKFTDNGILGQFKNGYNLTLSGAGKGFLTPRLMHSYSKKDVNPEYDVYRADVYSLGMTLLQAATLKDPHKNYYDWITKEVNSNAVEKGLKDVETRYSLQLAKYIASMLDEDDRSRPDFLYLASGALPIIHKPSLPVHSPSKIIPERKPVPPPVQSYPAPVYQPQVLPQPQPPVLPLYQSQPQYVQPNFIQQSAYVPPPPLHTSGFQPAYVQPVGGSQFLPPQARNYGGISYVSQQSPQKKFGNVEDLSDLDKRVQEAIRTTEETINRNSQIPNLVETQLVGEPQKE